jgi:hypothetical protein
MPDPIVYGFPRSTFVNIVRLVLTHKDVRYTFHDLEAVRIGVGADIAIGFSNGLLGGLTGLGGVISTISCQLRGWPKDVQRAVFQPVLFVAFVVISISQAVAGSITGDTLALYGLGVPFMVAGLWSGFKLFGKINDETFRKTVLVLLLFAGLSLILPILMQIPFERH